MIMQDSTINYLVHLLKKDGLIFQKDFTADKLTKEVVEKLQKKLSNSTKHFDGF